MPSPNKASEVCHNVIDDAFQTLVQYEWIIICHTNANVLYRHQAKNYNNIITGYVTLHHLYKYSNTSNSLLGNTKVFLLVEHEWVRLVMGVGEQNLPCWIENIGLSSLSKINILLHLLSSCTENSLSFLVMLTGNHPSFSSQTKLTPRTSYLLDVLGWLTGALINC